jgi:hypothetical protein
MLYTKNQVLHVIFPKMPGESQSKRHTAFLKKEYEDDYTRSIVKEVRDASARYEGPNQFVGFNLPARFVHRSEPILWSKIHGTRKSARKSARKSTRKHSINKGIRYLIAYMDGDTESKEHELRHAKYFLDKDYKSRVRASYKNLRSTKPSVFNRITKKLKEQGYKPEVFEDEFGAYYPQLVKK